jgi:23S rRNA (adenine2503-C2)-methyltransferase
MFEATSEDTLNAFVRAITLSGITINVRRSKGKDIDAACGQLANK